MVRGSASYLSCILGGYIGISTSVVAVRQASNRSCETIVYTALPSLSTSAKAANPGYAISLRLVQVQSLSLRSYTTSASASLI